VTEQLPDERVQVVELKVPELSDVKAMVPVGVTAVPPLVSLTAAVQVVAALTASEAGEHERVVEVVLFMAVTLAVFELVEWSVSPP
jgi:hypothetical protein